jgi:hypothetical protein
VGGFLEMVSGRDDQILWVAAPTTVESTRRDEHDAAVVLTGGRPGPHDPIEVLDVLGDDRSSASADEDTRRAVASAFNRSRIPP